MVVVVQSQSQERDEGFAMHIVGTSFGLFSCNEQLAALCFYERKDTSIRGRDREERDGIRVPYIARRAKPIWKENIYKTHLHS